MRCFETECIPSSRLVEQLNEKIDVTITKKNCENENISHYFNSISNFLVSGTQCSNLETSWSASMKYWYMRRCFVSSVECLHTTCNSSRSSSDAWNVSKLYRLLLTIPMHKKNNNKIIKRIVKLGRMRARNSLFNLSVKNPLSNFSLEINR